MFISRTRFNLKPPFKSELSYELVKLYRFFLGREDITKLPITIRESILEPGMIVVNIPVHLGSLCLRPAEDLLEQSKRKKESEWRQRLIKSKRK